MPYLRNYKEFEGEILDLQLEKYGLSFETKKYTTSGWAQGDENVIGIRAFKVKLQIFLKRRLANKLIGLSAFYYCPFSVTDKV